MRDIPTDRQGVVLAFVADFTHREGCPPTLREIGEHICVRSTNGVNDHVEALERKGYVERRSPVPPAVNRPTRGIRLTDKGREYLATQQSKETTA